MPNKHPHPHYEIGRVGWDIIRTKLLLNVTGHGFSVAACDPKSLGSKNTAGVTRIGG